MEINVKIGEHYTTRGAEKPVLGGWCEARVTGLKAEDGSAAICWPLWRDCRVRVQQPAVCRQGGFIEGALMLDQKTRTSTQGFLKLDNLSDGFAIAPLAKSLDNFSTKL